MDGFRAIIAAWTSAINLAQAEKDKRFGADAATGMRLLTGPYNWMYDNLGVNDPHFSFQQNRTAALQVAPQSPSFRMSVNKVAELVQLFAPALYHKNPHRQVTPRKPFVIDSSVMNMLAQQNYPLAAGLAQFMYQGVQQDNIDQINTQIISCYLNSSPNPMGLFRESRRAIDEALITGAGVLWTDTITPDGTQNKVTCSLQDSIENLILDTGMPTHDRAKWAVRKRRLPLMEVAKKFQIDPEKLRPIVSMESMASAAVMNSKGSMGLTERARKASYDIVTYYEIYSRAGLGAQMKQQMQPSARALCDMLAGDFAYLCVAPGLDFPLNCPPELFDQVSTPESMQALKQRFAWPIPFWADGSWPFTMIYFHEVPNDVWPMSHLAPAMGELKFLNWFYSFIAGKILITSRDFIAVKKKANKAVREALINGSDLTLIEIEESSGLISETVQWLNHPNINGDVFKVADIIEHQFEKRTGMTELAYGFTSHQYRSAAEAEIKNQATSVRPDDMANKVEEQMSDVARKEAVAARFTLQPADVSFLCGPVAGALWGQYVMNSDPSKAIYETDYRIEAGSIRKPNRSRDAENMTAFSQTFGPFFQQLALGGMSAPFNKLIEEWCKVRDMNPDGFQVQIAPPPPPAQQGGGQQGSQPAQ